MKQLLLLLVFSLILCAQPKLYVEENTQDWGTIEAKETVLKHTYIIKNSGTDTLRISRVKPGCSCTVVSYTATIAPNESGFVNAGLSIHPTSRTQNKSISVYSNDPAASLYVLHLKANPLGPVNLETRFKQYYANTAIVDTIKISTKANDLKLSNLYYEQRGTSKNAQKPLKINNITLKKLSRSKADSFGYYHYSYQLAFKINTDSRQSGTVHFTTNHPQMKNGQIRCFVDILNKEN